MNAQSNHAVTENHLSSEPTRSATPQGAAEHPVFETEILEYHSKLLGSTDPSQELGEEYLAPLVTSCAFKRETNPEGTPQATQYGLLAGIIEDRKDPEADDDRRMFFNISPPSSTFICGAQGSGRATPCLAGNLFSPLTGLVFHYDTFISDRAGSPCEAAFLSSHDDVECSYSRFDIEVAALQIDQSNLNTQRMLDLMAVGQESGPIPLYMHTVQRILRELRIVQQATNVEFNYQEFRRRVMSSGLTPPQLEPLKQRLDTLESFMPQTPSRNAWLAPQRMSRGSDWKPKARRLTIVDLSCPCISPETACALFNVCLTIFLEQAPETARVVGLDEAHKYMNASIEARKFTDTLLSAVRLQRHLGIRMIISTQEPTISATLLSLCSTTIVHRFTSPDWLKVLHRHLAGAAEEPHRSDPDDPSVPSHVSLLNQIVDLQVGEALLFSPSAIIKASASEAGDLKFHRLGAEHLRIRVRQRITSDGGKSVLSL
ncbi:uncharacterized protein BO66DRAFT_451249 [Aspergillus aculeatinus CBS 121060]|uniref:Uncharacterized protein n=1 Tax=Aspergillus aculeatinus CBS 121060 TaxID=1448322 RepID=A0ACD1HAB8_9EURO|nr:hypothetical protein BO66DRAFT_451249 [Aspergillus aculeatinus CBS 121060]RAH70357.1 hypothetical protein BO66DRAFT_451249 [Aspergillus aculeatinus CBS 121060]